MEFMKKFGRIVLTYIIAFVMLFVCGQKVMAAQPSSVGPVVANGTVGSEVDVYFNIKEAGNYKAFCTSGLLTDSPFGNTCQLMLGNAQWDEPTQAAIAAIIEEYQNNNIQGTYGSYWYAEVAINSYLKPGSMEVNGSQAEKKDEVIRLINLAKQAYNMANTDFSLKLSADKLTFTKVGDYYVSNAVTVSGDYINSFDVVVSKDAEIIERNANSFKVRIPVSKVEIGQSFDVSVTITGKKSYKVAKNYDCGSGVQNITINYLETRTVTSKKEIKGTVTRDGNEVKISKQDATNGKELAGAKLVLKDKNGKVVDSWESQTTPHVIKNLKPGEYSLTETIAPIGYKKTDTTVKFVVNEDGKVDYPVVMLNEPIKTGVKLSKTDITGQKELVGAELQIRNVETDEKISWKSTGKTEFVELKPGKYELTEKIAPKGYKKSSKTVKFEVKADGTIETVTFTNEPLKTGVKLSKTDITGQKELKDATLLITNAKTNSVVRSWKSTGKTEFIELEPGDYILTEITAPKGYKKSEEKVNFTVKDDGTVETVVFKNEPLKTGVVLSKTDITGEKEIANAMLLITNAKTNSVVRSWKSTGKREFIELEPGDYILTEILSPKGYKKSEEKVNFTVKDDGTVETVVFKNEPLKTGVRISKQDVTSKQELPGAVLVVKTIDGKEITSWTSGTEPVYIELEPGDYFLTEITAPDGYDLSYEVVRFTVNEDGQTTPDVVMYNSKTPVTADKNLVWTIVGFVCAGIVGAVAITKLKHQM